MRRLFLLMILFSWTATAKVLVFASPKADSAEYRAFVRSAPQQAFPSEYLLATFPDVNLRQRLADEFARAQLNFTEGSMLDAIAGFKGVVAFASQDQWPEEEQSVLLHSYLRLAQLQHGSAAESWLRLATVWARHGQVERDLFPPPLVATYEAAKSHTRTIVVSLRRFRRDFRFLLVNGETFDLLKIDRIEVADGPVRADWLSDIYQPIHASLPAAQLVDFQPPLRPWVEGTCARPTVHWPAKTPEGKAFFDLDCAAPNQKIIDLATWPTKTPALPPGLAETIPPPPPRPSASPPFYKNPWLWAAVGGTAVASILIIASNQHRSSTAAPTTAEGF